ncbi:unnamed protein product [Boreogadus saida]
MLICKVTVRIDGGLCPSECPPPPPPPPVSSTVVFVQALALSELFTQSTSHATSQSEFDVLEDYAELGISVSDRQNEVGHRRRKKISLAEAPSEQSHLPGAPAQISDKVSKGSLQGCHDHTRNTPFINQLLSMVHLVWFVHLHTHRYTIPTSPLVAKKICHASRTVEYLHQPPPPPPPPPFTTPASLLPHRLFT